MIMKNINKNKLLIIVFSIIISIVLGIFYYNNLPVAKTYDLSGNPRSISSNFAAANHCTFENNYYTPVDFDPYLVFSLEPVLISAVEIIFSETPPADTRVQIFYANDGAFTENDSKIVSMTDNSSKITQFISSDSYNTIRIDIDGIVGTIHIEDILVSDDYTVSISKVKHFDFVLYLFLVNVFLFVLLLLSDKDKIDNLLIYVKLLFSGAGKNKKKLLMILLSVLSSAAVSVIVELLLSVFIYSSYFIWQRCLFIFVICLVAIFIYIFKSKPEKLFLCISLSVGILYSITMPISLNSWDEESHYPWAVEQAAVLNSYQTNADLNIRSIPAEVYFNKDLREDALGEKNEDGKLFSSAVKKNISGIYNNIGHIPSGAGIFLGRCLGLSWAVTFILGRICNLIAYSFIIYFAIKRIIYGKYIIAVIGLIPTALFLASNYQYDNWVISWLILGTAYFIAELQKPDSKAELKSIIIMLLAFVIGLGPKAVYFPLMFMLFFLSNEKFNTQKHYRYYIYGLTFSILFIFSSFAVPFLFSPGEGDQRAAIMFQAEVTASKQFQFILSNPIYYAKTLLKFISGYLKFTQTQYYLVNYSYLGIDTNNLIFIVIFITAVVFTDKNIRSERINTGIKAATLTGCLLSVMLILTALYISFTPVGSSVIQGVQPRYLLPFLCPALLMLRSWDISNSIKENHYSIAVFSLSSFFLLSGFWTVCISKYH